VVVKIESEEDMLVLQVNVISSCVFDYTETAFPISEHDVMRMSGK